MEDKQHGRQGQTTDWRSIKNNDLPSVDYVAGVVLGCVREGILVRDAARAAARTAEAQRPIQEDSLPEHVMHFLKPSSVAGLMIVFVLVPLMMASYSARSPLEIPPFSS